MERDGKDILIRMFIMEIFIMARLMVRESTFGRMEKFMMDNGKKVLNMDMVYGKEHKEILMLVNGNFHSLMDMGSIFGQMVIGMKENGNKV